MWIRAFGAHSSLPKAEMRLLEHPHLPVPRLSARSGAPPACRCPTHLHIGGVNTLTRLPASVRYALLHGLAHHIASGLEVPSASGFDGFCSCMVCRRRPAHLTRLLTSPLCAAWNRRIFHPAGVRAACLAHNNSRPDDHARERVLIICPAVRGALLCFECEPIVHGLDMRGAGNYPPARRECAGLFAFERRRFGHDARDRGPAAANISRQPNFKGASSPLRSQVKFAGRAMTTERCPGEL